ncbi:hypothetical protein LOK49_LG04G00952 [Camellia lanceoleosa]|uniref:Uncharacterized protein n=1 Tax=Camellia lanceoleosa TaxID=1840588 RepID=A0ACC0HXP6_9ERIC|nr:hypothetical protein LOK49_LG04G00952 [Camellia lanceoleosa]
MGWFCSDMESDMESAADFSIAKVQKSGRKKHKVRWMSKSAMAIPQVIIELQDQALRECTLRCLSTFLLENREDPENYYRTGFLLYNSCSTIAVLLQVVLPNIVEKSNVVTLSQGRIDNDNDSRLAKVEKQVIKIHALLVQVHKDTRQDEDEKHLTKLENQVGKILELLEKCMPVDGEQVKTPPSKLLAEQRLVKMENQVGQILELLERRIPCDGGHVKTPPSKLHEEHRIDIEMVDLDVSGIEKVAANSPKFVDEDEIKNMNDKEPIETSHLRKTNLILTPPNAKVVAKKRAKLVGGKALNNERLSIPQNGRSRAKKSDTKAVEVNAVTKSSSCSVVHGPQTRGTQNCRASQ